MQIEITSNSSVFTKKLGEQFSKVISSGDIILFVGELGGGKTTFISGLAKGLDVKNSLSSPSFTILNIYKMGRVDKLVHADFYRLGNIGDIIGVGIEEYLYDSSSVVCIEWGDKIKKYIKKDYVEIEINYLLENEEEDSVYGSGSRLVAFRSNSQYWDNKLTKFIKRLDSSVRQECKIDL